MAGLTTKRGENGGRAAVPTPFSFRRELDEMFDRLWGGQAGWPGTDELVPTMDVSETEAAFRAQIDLPGVAAENIEIQVNGNLLTVTGTRFDEQEEQGRTFHRMERSSGRFSRSLALPCDVQEDQVSAQFDGGVLTIELPKAEEAKPRKIRIK